MASDKIQAENRAKRVAQALRANLKRRKAQARTRTATSEEQELAAAAEMLDKEPAKSPSSDPVKDEGKTN